MKRRLFGILMTLTLCLALSVSASAEETTVPNDIYSALSTGGTITLQNDVDFPNNMVVSNNLTIDLNGHVLNLSSDDESRITVENGGSLTIIDSNPSAEHKFMPNADGLWELNENGTKSVSGGVITGGSEGNGGGVKIETGGSLTMTGGNIVGCRAGAMGGGVYVSRGSSFTMNGGSIAGCVAYSDSPGIRGGGVYVDNGQKEDKDNNLTEVARGVFTMNDGSIIDCAAKDGTGGSVYIKSGVDESDYYGLFIMNGGSISDSGVSNGGICSTIYNSGTFLANDGTVTNSSTGQYALYNWSIVQTEQGKSGTVFSGAILTGISNSSDIGGGIFNGPVTNYDTISGGTFTREVTNYGKITGGDFTGTVTNNGSITGGTFNDEITGTPAFATGSGTEADPYLIYSAEGLKAFRDIVNGTGGQTQNAGARAKLMNDIGLNNEEWTPIGNDNKPYTGTFDGQGYTINGLNIDDADHLYVGLFGYIEGATIKNLTVAGTVKSSDYAGGIVGGAVKNSTIENCWNDCRIVSETTDGGSTNSAGIVSWASNTIIVGCVNTGIVEAKGGSTGEAGGIVSALSASVTIRNCCNTGEVKAGGSGTFGAYAAGGIVGASNAGTIVGCYNTGTVTLDYTGEAERFSWVGGIVGSAGYFGGEVYDCFNIGAVKSLGKVTYAGGVVGRNYDAKVYNCYNAGVVTGPLSGGVIGINSDAVENCYYLDSTAAQPIAKNDAEYGGTVDEATGPKTAAEFGDGTVLALLINDRTDIDHPWNSRCQYLTAADRTLPVFKTQTGDPHTHDWSAWTHMEGTETHCRSCACNAVETANCSGGTATCTEKAKCAVCGAKYGAIDPDHHGDKLKHVEAKAATTREEGNIEYWHCEACGKYYSDADTKKEIARADTVIPKRQSSGGGSSGSSPSYPITVPDKTGHGTVSANRRYAERGDTVTITVTPDSGYVLETISVTDRNGNDLKLTDKGNGKYTFTMPGSKVEVKATFMEDNSVPNFFYDVPNDAYCYEAVKWAVENGITGGVGNSLFAPNQPCTRAQIVTFLWRAAGSPVVNYAMDMADVAEDAYYAEAVRWALSEGITTGTGDGKFSPNATCTRAQSAVFLYRYMQSQGTGFTGAWMFQLPFTDVPEWCYEAVAWCYMKKVTDGTTTTTFSPDDDCTRAQIVTFLYRTFMSN